MASWSGKSLGQVVGYKIFVFIITYGGTFVSYLVLRFVAFYYIFGAWQATKTGYNFYRKRLGFSKLKAAWSAYQNHYAIGQVLLDKVAILSGHKKRFTFNFDGRQHLTDMVAQNKGAILISAHVGNWEAASQLLEHLGAKVNVVMLDVEYDQIKDYLSSVTGEKKYNIIAISQDGSHVFEMARALSNNEIICIHGDRFVDNSKVVSVPFMGEEAYFPFGPFSMAQRLKVPTTFVYAMKEGATHYHFFAAEPSLVGDDLEAFVSKYAASVEEKVRQYPYQWFNYYNFWAKDLPGITVVNDK